MTGEVTSEITMEQIAAITAQDLALVNRGVDWFADSVRERIAEEPLLGQMLVEAYLEVFLGGGKRARGGLVMAGYGLYNGTDTELASRLAGLMEGVQATALTFDDVSDSSPTRRGGDTTHVKIEHGLRGLGATDENLMPMAMNLADNTAFGMHLVTQSLLEELDMPDDRRRAISSVLCGLLLKTGMGQTTDIFSTTNVMLTEAQILYILRAKTAHYTIELPFKIGVLAAGGGTQEFPRIERYADGVGIAFQLIDDVLGVFGDEATMGKSPKSDIMEGKQTLLMHYALMAASDEERAVLRAARGNKALTDEAFEECKKIIESTGARARVEALARDYSRQAQEALADAPASWNPVRVRQLGLVAIGVVNRSK